MTTWQKSSFSQQGNCVEVARLDKLVLLRDSKYPEKQLVFTHAEWDAFLAGAKDGEFDIDGQP